VIRLALRVAAEHADIVLAELLELAPAGVEEVRLAPDGEPLARDCAFEGRAGFVEYALYGSPGELPELPDLYAAVGGIRVEVRTSEIADDWDERWKQFHRPVLVEGERHSLRVRAPWMPALDDAGVDEIVIDPGQAFGTGAHPTTRMCLELLLALAAREPRRGPVIDVGAGSGVLSIAAARLGYEPVLALDNEIESVQALTHNAGANCVAVQARRFDLRRERLPAVAESTSAASSAAAVGPLFAVGHPPAVESAPVAGPAPAARLGSAARIGSAAGLGSAEGAYAAERPFVVLANLLRGLLLGLSASIVPALAPTHLIVSGLLCEEAGEVARAFGERLGFSEQARREQGGWAALLLSRR
jgi:ribosomal protein L11 methyltransferase